jgi:hypothetical protein
MGWYGRTMRRAPDLSRGDTRVYLEFELRRAHCRACCKVVPSELTRHRPMWFGGAERSKERVAQFYGAALVRELARQPEVAAPEAL